MTEILPPVPVVENVALTPEATDESLIHAARELNASYNGHLKRSMEDFWKLGETLLHLYQRHHLQGRWADILQQVGINITTDNHARRLYQATTLDGLAKFKNKTQALRFFGILSTPRPSVKMLIVSSPEVSLGESEEYTESSSMEQIVVECDGGADGDRLVKARQPVTQITPTTKCRAVEPLQVPDEKDDDRTPPTIEKPAARQADDSLEVVAMVAARLEILAETAIDVTPDHLAQIDRAILALDRLRRKGVADAA